MHVAIDSHRGANLVVALQAADSHGHVVDHAESLAVVGKRMMKSAADADADSSVRHCRAARIDPPAASQNASTSSRRVGNFHFHFFARAERAGLQLLHILRRVHQQNVLIGRGLRFEKICGLGDAVGDQPVVNAPIFFGGEDVVADGKVVGVAVDELEGEHGAFSSYRHALLDSLSCHPEDGAKPVIEGPYDARAAGIGVDRIAARRMLFVTVPVYCIAASSRRRVPRRPASRACSG